MAATTMISLHGLDFSGIDWSSTKPKKKRGRGRPKKLSQLASPVKVQAAA